MDPIGELAKEAAKQLPVKEAYSDLLSPGMKQAGGAVEDIAKTLRIALLPFEAGGALYDRLSGLIDGAIRKVPEEQRQAPPPQILGPIVEGIRYEGEGSPLYEMFAELLSRGFDTNTVGEAHPSYPSLIRQLSADEARLLGRLNDARMAGERLVLQVKLDWDEKGQVFSNPVVEVDQRPLEVLVHPQQFDFYVDHLHNLGLVGFYDFARQDPIRDGSGRQIGTRRFQHLAPSPMGSKFMEVVTPRAAT